MIKAALEALGLVVFLSDVGPGGNLQRVIAEALASCKLAIILATKTYGETTNGLFDTSNEMNFIVGRNKPYYLVRMIPFGEDWAEPATTLAFPQSIMQRVRTPLPYESCLTQLYCMTLHRAGASTEFTRVHRLLACSCGSQVLMTQCRGTSCPRCAMPSAE